MTTGTNIADALRSFLNSCSRAFEFPMGGNTTIPMESESALILALQQSSSTGREEISLVREKLTFRECYACVIFSVRMAILAARIGNADYLKAGLFGLVFDNGNVDYRDTLGALSIVENCAKRLRCDFASELNALCELIEDDRVRATIEAYLSRSPEMRTVEVMGFTAVESKEGLSFVYGR